MKTAKILHLRSGTDLYGPERVILALARYASAAYKPIIGSLGNNEDSPLLLEAAENGVETYSLRCNGRVDKRAIASLRDYIEAEEIALVNSHDFKANFYALAAVRGLKKNKTRLVATLHNWKHSFSRAGLYEILDALYVRKFDGLIAVSSEIAEGAQRWLIPKHKLRVIPNGIELERFCRRPERANNGHIIIGSVGRLVWQKGYENLLKAAAQVCQVEAEARFLLIGEGPRRVSLELLAKELRIEGKVEFAGRRDAIECGYGAMDIFVSPSVSEGLPIALLEAMAARKPIIATTVGGVPEVIEDEKSGLLVAPNNIRSLAEAIISLIKDRAKAQALAAAAYDRVFTRFSGSEMARQTEKVYKEILYV